MQRFKHRICILLGLCLLLPFTFAAAQEDGELKILTTIFAPYDFMRQIAGDHAQVEMLLPPGTESHSFEPTPQDIIKIQGCDVFVYVGGANDVWVDRILESVDTEQKTVLRLVDLVQTVPEEFVEGMEHVHDADHDSAEEPEDHDHEEDHGHEAEDPAHSHGEDVVDEHVWTSPKNAITIVEAFATTLEALDPAHAEAFDTATREYVAQLRTLDGELEEITQSGARRLLIFGDRFPFRYLADAYGLEYYAAFSGCSTDTEASAKTIAFLIDQTAQEQVPVVFTIELSNGRIADAICESTGAKKLEMHSAHNVTRQDFQEGITYLEIMERNAQVLKEALN